MFYGSRPENSCADTVLTEAESYTTETKNLSIYIDKKVPEQYKIVQNAKIPMDKRRVLRYDGIIQYG